MGIFKNALKTAIMKKILSSKTKSQSARKRETHTTRVIKEKQMIADRIREQAREQSQQLLKIVRECTDLVNTTSNPEVFFSRYNLMLEHLESLAGLECTGIFENSSELPSEAFLRIENQFIAAANDFLDRSFASAKVHADTLKTENGKKNAIKRYFENMEKYIVQMPGESLEHFDKMK